MKAKRIWICMVFVTAFLGTACRYVPIGGVQEKLDEVLLEYMSCITEKNYEKMYRMIDAEVSGNVEKEAFIRRNSNIYEGIEIQDMRVEVTAVWEEEQAVSYTSHFETVAGEISFSHTAYFTNGEGGCRLIWDDSLIFPELEAADKVRVSYTKAARGRILDREGRVMAGQGTATSVGLVPMRMEEGTIEKLSSLLDISAEAIEDKISASWVKEDSFVPVTTLPKVEELELLSGNADSGILDEFERQKEILEIPGVMFQEKEIREYPYKEAAAHLIGYVQSVTAEDLEEHSGEGYRSDSVIGRSGMERLYEKELEEVRKGMSMVVNHPEGTGYAAHREDVMLAGKTGTAEIKASQDDADGTELGWFAVVTEEPEIEKPLLLLSMVEDVKGVGGSGYVVEKTAAVLDGYY